MSTIDFVVRDSAGNIERGSVGEGGTSSTVVVGAGQDVSLNLSRGQILSYSREGQALNVVLIDGSVITIEGFFSPEGMIENRLFVSSSSRLAEVDLVSDGTGIYQAQYVDAAEYGKWSPDDDLYFVRGPEVQLADAYDAAVYEVGDDEVGMLATPLLGGIGGLGSALGLGGAVVGGGVILGGGGGGGGSNPAPTVTLTSGTEGAGDFVNEADHADGVEIGGEGDVGATVAVTIAGVTQTTTVADDGTWEVIFSPQEILPGEYETDVSVVITNENGSGTATDVLIVDTIAGLGFDTSTVEGEGIINAAEAVDGFTLTGTTEAGSSVVVTIDGVDYDAVVTGTSWTLVVGAGVVAGGEYDLAVTASSTDPYGNTTSITQTIEIDTETSVAFSGDAVEGDNTVNASEASNGVTLNGTAQAGSTVMVTLGAVTLPAAVDAAGNWSVDMPAGALAAGEYTATATAVATDANGNAATTTMSFEVDTETTVTFGGPDAGADGVINAVEHADGVTLSGTAEPGATVVVNFGTGTQTVVAGAGGAWAADFAASYVPTGEADVAVSVSATDLAGNTATTTGSVTMDTFVNTLDVTGDQIGGADGVVNFDEVGQAITVSGAVEPGSTVTVKLGNVNMNASVDGTGNWTVTYPAGTLPAGDYTTAMIVTAIDAAGNTSSLSESVRVDTVAGDLALSATPIEGDDVINFVEESDGVVISGTATAGLMVTVTLDGVEHFALAGPTGQWSTTYYSDEINNGTYNADITAQITDAAGNTKLVTDVVKVDTQVDNLAFAGGDISADGIISAADAAGSVVLTGTVEPGSSVVVTMGGASRSVTAGSNGQWSATFTDAMIANGEYSDVAVTATATDPAGNVETISTTVDIDTIVSTLTVDGPVEGNDVVSAAEASDGITLNGMVEAGSTVMVTFEGTTRAATVAADGNWTVNFAAGEIPAGEYETTVSILATDHVGNTSTITDTFAVDTLAPEAPVIDKLTITPDGVENVFVADGDNAISVATIDANGNATQTHAAGEGFDLGSELLFSFDTALSDGTNMIVTETDANGNAGATLVVTEVDNQGGGSAAVSLGGDLGNYDISMIDLSFDEASVLNITAAQLEAMSDNTNDLYVRGGSDDQVNAIGANNTFTSTTVEGTTYDIYTMGDEDGMLYIEQGINVTY